MKTLLVGMGNPILTDDSVGVRLAQQFKELIRSNDKVDVVEECSVGGLNLLDVFAGYDRAIVLDSVKTKGGVPGAWYFFDANALRETEHLTNVHDANFATAMELGRRVGMALPAADRIYVFGVEVADNITFSENMTPALAAAYPQCAKEIWSEVSGLLATS